MERNILTVMLLLRVFNAAEGYDKAYDFGRYGKTWGLMGSRVMVF